MTMPAQRYDQGPDRDHEHEHEHDDHDREHPYENDLGSEPAQITSLGAAERPELSIVGRLVALGPIRHDLQPVYRRWREDVEAGSLFGGVGGWRESTAGLGQALLIGAAHWHEESWFTIYALDTWQPVGHASLVEIDLLSGGAELSVFIGEAAARGHGYGTETIHLLLDYAFTGLRLDTISTTVNEFDLVTLDAYTDAGFREVDRCSRLRGSILYEEILLECFVEDFPSAYR